MRTRLKELQGQILEFSARISHLAYFRGSNVWRLMLLKVQSQQTTEVLTNHAWIDCYSTSLIDLASKRGKIVEFQALVCPYKKSRKGKIITDYKLRVIRILKPELGVVSLSSDSEILNLIKERNLASESDVEFIDKMRVKKGHNINFSKPKKAKTVKPQKSKKKKKKTVRIGSTFLDKDISYEEEYEEECQQLCEENIARSVNALLRLGNIVETTPNADIIIDENQIVLP
jgi:hypothetical protein